MSYRVYNLAESEKNRATQFSTSRLEQELKQVESSITEEEKQLEELSELPTIQAEELKAKRHTMETISKKLELLSTKTISSAGSYSIHPVPESLEVDLA